MVGDVGAILGPVLAGLVVEWGGYPSAFSLTSAIAVMSFASWRRAPETVVHLEGRRAARWPFRGHRHPIVQHRLKG
jgi:MFS family permease